MLLFVWFFAYHDHVTWQVVWVPLIALVQFVYTLGFTFMISAITVFYRDVGIVIGHFMRLLFWISPILWSFMDGRRSWRSACRAAMGGVDRFLGLPKDTLFTVISLQPHVAADGGISQGPLRSARITDKLTDQLDWKEATLPNFARCWR